MIAAELNDQALASLGASCRRPGGWMGSGSFRNKQGNGQAIDFIAFNILKVTSGLVTDNWHLEDNLTLLSQMGLAEVKQ